MRAALLALLLLPACAPTADESVAYSGGLLALVHDGVQVQVAGAADGVMPATGSLWSIDEVGANSRGISITADQVEVMGVFDQPEDLAARVALTRLNINSSLLAGDTGAQGAEYRLGPNGGTIWLTRIETKADGSYRVRGQFDGSICPTPDATSDCHRIEGVFAFDQTELPANAITGNLIAPAP